MTEEEYAEWALRYYRGQTMEIVEGFYYFSRNRGTKKLAKQILKERGRKFLFNIWLLPRH